MTLYRWKSGEGRLEVGLKIQNHLVKFSKPLFHVLPVRLSVVLVQVLLAL